MPHPDNGLPPMATNNDNPFEDLVDLPDAPALPPLAVQDGSQFQDGGEPFQPETQDGAPQELLAAAATTTTATTLDPASLPKITKSAKFTLHFKSDLTKSTRSDHPCGILHFVRQTLGGTEEHAFVWIAYYQNTMHLSNVLKHMSQFGFIVDNNEEGSGGNVQFIPYSSRRSWIEHYPMAFPHVHCNELGVVTGFPYFSGNSGSGGVGGVSGGIDGTAYGRMLMANNAASAGGVASAGGGETPSSKRGRKKKKIFSTAHLGNAERDELHIEMYKYLQWLSNNLSTSGGGELATPGRPKGASGSAAGINVTALQNMLLGMESTFKVVRTAKPTLGTGQQPTLPFLEEVLSEPLGRLVEAVKRNPEVKASRKSRARGLDFEDMYERLLRFRLVCLFFLAICFVWVAFLNFHSL